MEPITPITPLEPVVPVTLAPPTASPNRLRGVSRGLTTLGLAVGLLAVGGAAVVMAASPEPSSSTAPGTIPGTQPSTTDGSGAGTTDRPKGPCPAEADGTDGTSPSTPATPSAPSTTPSTTPSTAPSVPTT